MEARMDYFGARYLGAGLGRFVSADPKFIGKARIADPQQWNLYAYVRNNPLVAVDPDGRELRIVIVNKSDVRPMTMAKAARAIRTNYEKAGVQNVTVSFDSTVPPKVLADQGVDKRTVYLEYQKNHNGDVRVTTGADGKNPSQQWFQGRNEWGGPGGSAAGVETTSTGVIPSGASEDQAVEGLAAVGTHESAHKWLDGTALGEEHPDDIMNHGRDPLRNVPFKPHQAKRLREALNTPEEEKARLQKERRE